MPSVYVHTCTHRGAYSVTSHTCTCSEYQGVHDARGFHANGYSDPELWALHAKTEALAMGYTVGTNHLPYRPPISHNVTIEEVREYSESVTILYTCSCGKERFVPDSTAWVGYNKDGALAYQFANGNFFDWLKRHS